MKIVRRLLLVPFVIRLCYCGMDGARLGHIRCSCTFLLKTFDAEKKDIKSEMQLDEPIFHFVLNIIERVYDLFIE